MSRVAERAGVSPAEYLAWERKQPIRHEFFRGEVFAMTRGAGLEVDVLFEGVMDLPGA